MAQTTLDYEPNMVLATKTYDVVGTRPIRHDGADKVTGRALYGADFDTAGLLHGKILRSPHAHARIRSVDTSAAEALPGVAAVVVSADFASDADAVIDLGESETTLKWLRDNVLASDKALYRGHAVAGVAAANPHVAEEAVGAHQSGLRSPAAGRDRRAGDGGRRAHPPRQPQDERARRRDRHCEQYRRTLPAQEGRRRPRGSPRRTWSSSASTARRPSIRATSSRTTPRRSGTRTAGCTSGAARRARSRCATPWRSCSTCPCPTSA